MGLLVAGNLTVPSSPYTRYMHAQICMQGAYIGVVTDWGGQSSRHEQRVTMCAFEEFEDISERCCSLHLAPKWHGTITVFSLHSACVFAFAPLVLRGVDCGLLPPRTPLSRASVFIQLECLALFVGAGMCWLLTLIWNRETTSTTTALGTNCIPKCDKCLCDRC